MATPDGSNKNQGPKGAEKPRNPALQALGLPRLRLPSRNWMIFWVSVGSITGIWYHDRRERKRIRQEWKDSVSKYSKEPLTTLELPRKVFVYIAPPPGDYLEHGLDHFRQYVKPILTAAAVDYELRQETRQGEIRYHVAERIRERRRKGTTDLPTCYQTPAFLGLPQLEFDPEGGVLCVGRGAYKEYLNGFHEGWLGPLDPETSTKNPPTEIKTLDSVKVDDNATTTTTTENDGSIGPEEDIQEEEENKPKRPSVPKPLISYTEYSQAALPFEYTNAYVDPICFIPHHHIMGFLNTPQRIYRWFHKRDVAKEVCSATAAAIIGEKRPFEIPIDENVGIDEESEWPKKWVAQSKDKNSEWTWPLQVDPRITSRMELYQLAKKDKNDS